MEEGEAFARRLVRIILPFNNNFIISDDSFVFYTYELDSAFDLRNYVKHIILF